MNEIITIFIVDYDGKAILATCVQCFEIADFHNAVLGISLKLTWGPLNIIIIKTVTEAQFRFV